MIHFIGHSNFWCKGIVTTTFLELEEWMGKRRSVQFDVETVPAKWWQERTLRTIQFGDWMDQYVVQWSALAAYQKERVKRWLEDERLEKVIHNALFECTIMLFNGVRVQNVFDTMLAEQVLWGGEQGIVGYGLDDTSYRRLRVELDKSYQMSFGGDTLTEGQIRYASQDVKYLHMLKQDIYQELQGHGLEWVVALENAVVPVFAEMVYHGMSLDVEHWQKLAAGAEPLIAEAEEKLNGWLKEEEFVDTAYRFGYLHHEDSVLLNWNSPKQKQAIFQALYPELPGTSKAVLKKYVSDKIKEIALVSVAGGEDEDDKDPYPEWLPFYLEGDYGPLQAELLSRHRDWLIEEGLLIPAGQATINWNSQQQALPIFQCIDRKILDLSSETLGRVGHALVADYQHYKDMLKLTSSYGERFIEKHLNPDGKIRTDFNQVLTTGRISSHNPNMQNIPAKEEVGNKYRNAFIPEAGSSFVSTDFVSQELVIIAYLSKDPVWKEALRKRQDLHSVAAELVYGRKWRDAADPGCTYYQMVVGEDGRLEAAHKKCKCSRHKWMRTACKSINFGLAYGMSHFKLASELRITVPEAKQIIEDYFHAFPGIGRLLTYLGNFGVEKGYIQTIYPFFRKRWFPMWKYYLRFVEGHVRGIHYHAGLGEIERASKNMPIQGTAADMMKVALWMVYDYIHSHHLEGKVYMAMQVHDQLDSVARDDYREQWAPIQTRLMEEAAKVFIPTGILRADTTITERWSK